jgi:MFS family permease
MIMQSADNLSQPGAASRHSTLAERIAGSRYLGLSAFLFAFLQTLCPAVIALSAVRVFIGLGALAAAAGSDAPARGWHADWIRIPMMLLAAFGSALNLFILWHVRRLRARPAAQWRIAPLTAKKRRSERVQIVLAVLTFACLAAEWVTHPIMHHLHH